MIHLTEDGSPTLYNEHVGEHYHSTHGAVQESRHIFIKDGFDHRLTRCEVPQVLHLFEIGFGTGLNALLTLVEAKRRGQEVLYVSVEKYPVEAATYRQLHFDVNAAEAYSLLQAMHEAPWGEATRIAEGFTLLKIRGDLLDIVFPEKLDVIYFDAFSPKAQPQLWSEEVFARLFACAKTHAVLTTYCAKGEVRRRMQRVGFRVERLPGPPGKREILRATKINGSFEADVLKAVREE